MKLVLLTSLCFLGIAISAPITLDARQLPNQIQSPCDERLAIKATGASIQKAWTDVGKTYDVMTFVAKNAKSGLESSGFSRAHNDIMNEMRRAQCMFVRNSQISTFEGVSLTAQASRLTVQTTDALNELSKKWQLAVSTRERDMVKTSLMAELDIYQKWSAEFNTHMPTGQKAMGTGASENIIKQYRALINKYQWDVAT